MAAFLTKLVVVIAMSASRVVCLEVLVTGATGGTGAALYKQLKERGVGVRAFVRNVTKARELLGCDKCDPTEGIFEGDITAEDPLAEAAKGASALAIVTSAVPICTQFRPVPVCHYPEGAYPVDVDFHSGKAQIASFVRATGKPGHVVLCSSMGTTHPDTFLDKLGNGSILFYKLNFEAVLASSGLPFTIVKPCGLADTPAGKSELVVGHEDDLKGVSSVSRSDVATVMAEALLQPEASNGLRFDLCARPGPPTTDFARLFAGARYPWQQAPAPGRASDLLV